MIRDIIKTNILKEKKADEQQQKAEQQAFVNKLLAERQGIKNGQ